MKSGDELILDPVKGDLEAGQFIEIKLSLISSYLPSVYEGEVECVIFWDQNDGKTSEKETLFLRIKKRSILTDQIQSIPNEYNTNENDPNKHAFEILLAKAITDILNEPYLETQINKLDNQPVRLYGCFDGEEPAGIGKEERESSLILPKKNNIINYKDFNNLFLNEEFNELVDFVMENTFFNIMQETTRKEADLLRISKTFLIPNK